MSKCCLYCRVDGASTESNRLAINQQLTALRSLAGQLGFSISAEMLQYESGLDANRQSIRTLIRDARHGVYTEATNLEKRAMREWMKEYTDQLPEYNYLLDELLG